VFGEKYTMRNAAIKRLDLNGDELTDDRGIMGWKG